MKSKMDTRSIGVFDSGIGGLTVLKELEKQLPNENFVYLGDTLNFPYGDKTKEEIIKLSEKNIKYLISQKVKLCPKIAPNPAIIINKEAVSSLIGTPVHSVAMIGANRQDKKPLKASAKRTTDAALAPRIRNAFVAPILPLPCLRMSTPLSFPIR